MASAEAARRFWPARNPLGERLTLGFGEPVEREVVGIAADVKSDAINAPADPTVYLPYSEVPFGTMTVVVRTTARPPAPATEVRRQLRLLDDALPVESIAPMTSVVASTIERPRFFTRLLGLFSATALLLAASGIYALVAFIVSQRRFEFGVRMVLGARPSDIARLALAHGLRLSLLGVALGVGGALALTRLLSGLLFEVGPLYPLAFTAVPLLLVCAALLAAYLPVRRATRTDPALTLRYQ